MATYPAGRPNFILGTWVKAIMRALDAAGCDGAALVAEAGFDVDTLDVPNAHCPLDKTASLWRLAVAATGDSAFGLKVASHIKHTTFHALGYGLSASSTLREAFERIQRYCRLVSDALVGAFLRMCRSMSDRNYSLLLIELRRPQPPIVSDFEALLRAPL